ncbi:hypothetical protein [Rhodococcus sp. JVH1]|uniref:hypothetical protein n=1 Tax=Rhodococcus sp. JVH1 TaxID=745408 RepID=UPI0002720D1C|nr:hypothetical protein [Rhodococcus sp. JVH1]EJJ01047.1 hypothetical protein JVH1_1673 [Rhodococcus sp. JVH1]
MTFFPDNTANVVLAGPGAAADLPERAWYLSEHHLVGRKSCGVVLASGWADYTEPKANHLWFKTARGDGAFWLGAVTEPREFYLPIYVHKTLGQPFHEINDGIWSDIDYHSEARLHVNSTRGTRFVDFRLADQPKVSMEFDPAFDGFQPYLVPVICGRPWWYGPEDVFEWVNGQPVEGRKLRNSGDQKGEPAWTIQGPGAFQIPDGQGDTVVTTPNLYPGEIARIHTARSKYIAKSNMRPNLYRDMGAQRFRYPVPGRKSVDMSKLRVIGGNEYSSAVCTIHPKSRRPW